MNPAERMSDEAVTRLVEDLRIIAPYLHIEDHTRLVRYTADALESLQHEIADLRRDAERYLRIRNGPYSDRHGDVYAMIFEEEGDVPAGGEVLDAAVDLALRKGKRA